MRLVIATDIYGTHPLLRAMLDPLGRAYWLSPWPGQAGHPHDSEQAAVAAFHQQEGLAAYAQRIAQAMHGQPTFILGFSVGAASAWHAIATEACHPSSRAVLYYGSRIRDALMCTPRCPAQLVWAEYESAFQPSTLFPALQARGASCRLIASVRHGFMNPQSPHFHSVQAQAHVDWLRQALTDWRTDMLDRTKITDAPALAGNGLGG
ncbi:MAG: hypothetical protein Q4A98_03365 [Comamonadaceae bacterium]|nr:hypothetical protein [Comamonadaceae bacterium]